MTKLSNNAAIDKALKIDDAATRICSLIVNQKPISRKTLNTEMEQAFGESDANGAWSQRDSFEMAEHATVKALLAQSLASEPSELLAYCSEIAARLPTQTVRSENQVELQQFSTPLPMAALLWLLANPTADDLVLEPSAGTGLLAIGAFHARATLRLNEIDEQRCALLRLNFPNAATSSADAAAIHAQAGEKPSLILMNPPFARRDGIYDSMTAARHLQSAIAHLQPYGRLVAIMPDNFSSTGKSSEAYRKILSGCTVQAIYRLDKGFSKHGTSVSTKIFVIDKLPGSTTPTIINRPTIGDFAAFTADIPLRARISKHATAPAPLPTTKAKGNLFSAFKKNKPKPTANARSHPQDRVASVEYDVLDKPAQAEEQIGLYLPYRSSRLIFKDAGEHPTQLVESIAMGSIPTPKPSYIPTLPERTIKNRILSTAQLETLVLAGEATSQYLPGKYRLASKGLYLEPCEDGKKYRQGFFLGDGTGAGKGREIASIILDQWLKGKRKHIWISETAPLLDDARRDWTALGGIGIDIQPLANWKPSEAIPLQEGILYTTYATLRSGTETITRLQQVLAWIGEDYDGVIAFDEAHAMGGVAGGENDFGKTQGSLQGVTGVTLQNHVPEARVIYSSATGATDINNLAYAVRLGLWGPHTAFANRDQFISDIKAGGIAAMEVVARELKGAGLYVSRMLSYAGVEYDILEHKLTPDQIRDFDTYAEAWAAIHRNLEHVLELANVTDSMTGKTLNGQALAAARSRFESSKQRFFGQLLLTYKLPSLFPAIEADMEKGMSAVVQLVSTAEAMLDRRIADLTADQRASLDIDLSPRELILDYLQHAFPIRMMETYIDDSDNERSRPIFDECGNPVICEAACQVRDDMIEMIGAMPPIASALDALIERFGTSQVAEITGRSRRLVTLADGSQRLESRSARTNIVETERFMNGEKRILVFSNAGGTGRSYHASLACENQERRVHYLLEPGWRADKAIQGLGRTNRTHQASSPIFRPVTTDCRGERRFISTIARRLDSLGALTRGQRQTGGQNLFDPADNLESEYAKDALIQWFKLLAIGKLDSCSFAEFEYMTGLKLTKDGGLSDDLPPIQRWLNRILALPIRMQNAIFDEFLGLVEARIEAARAAGTLDIGVETILAEKIEIIDNKVLRIDERSGAQTNLMTIDLKWKKDVTPLDRIMATYQKDQLAKCMINNKTKQVAMLVPSRSFLTDDGSMLKYYRLIKVTEERKISHSDLLESAWKDCDEATFAAKWQADENHHKDELNVERIYMATGQLLPIWNKLSREFLEVRRLSTAEGQSLLGRIVVPADVNALLKTFGIEQKVNLSTSDILDGINNDRTVSINGTEALQAKISRVNFEKRIELVGCDPRRLREYKALGCYVEIIQAKSRIFIPRSKASAIIEALSKTH